VLFYEKFGLVIICTSIRETDFKIPMFYFGYELPVFIAHTQFLVSLTIVLVSTMIGESHQSLFLTNCLEADAVVSWEVSTKKRSIVHTRGRREDGAGIAGGTIGAHVFTTRQSSLLLG
jgi:hypothetical protein